MLEHSQGGGYSESTVNGWLCLYQYRQVYLASYQERVVGGTVDELEYVAVSRAIAYMVSQ